jgi:hypothetical protein
MNWFRKLFRRESPSGEATPLDIRSGMRFDKVVRLIGTPRQGGVSGTDILGPHSSDPRAADVFLFFDKHPEFDFSVRFSKGKVVSVQKNPKRPQNKPL